MNAKHLAVTAALSGLLLAPIVERELWRPWLLSLESTLAGFEGTIEPLAQLERNAFPHYRKVMLAREKLLADPRSHEIVLLNTDREVRQRISEILYPVTIRQRALLSLQLDMESGTLTVKPTAVSTEGAKQ